MNWKVRISNINFWLTIVPAILLGVQIAASIFGFTLDITTLQDKIIALIDVIFTILMIVGVVNDPTTVGFSDSNRAMTYTEPHDDSVEE